jgi:hypothetical protein
MKKTIAVLFSLFIVLLACLGVWYFTASSRAEAEANAATARKDAGKTIPVEFIVKAPAGETPANQFL